MASEKIQIIATIAPVMALACLAIAFGWIVTTWMRIKHGYPLESSWGKPIYPQHSNEAMERVKLLSQENARLRAELGSVKDRLQNVERIVTDGAHRLSHEIEALRGPAN